MIACVCQCLHSCWPCPRCHILIFLEYSNVQAMMKLETHGFQKVYITFLRSLTRFKIKNQTITIINMNQQAVGKSQHFHRVNAVCGWLRAQFLGTKELVNISVAAQFIQTIFHDMSHYISIYLKYNYVYPFNFLRLGGKNATNCLVKRCGAVPPSGAIPHCFGHTKQCQGGLEISAGIGGLALG